MSSQVEQPANNQVEEQVEDWCDDQDPSESAQAEIELLDYTEDDNMGDEESESRTPSPAPSHSTTASIGPGLRSLMVRI